MRLEALLLATLLVATAQPAAAAQCTIDEVPAATLLLPYFEVDLVRPTGITTLLSVNNASLTPVLAKAEVWSDMGVPIFGFTMYLSGLDVQTINLREVLVDGKLPQTSPPAGLFPSCVGALPPPTIPATLRASYRRALTGQPSTLFGGLCAGRRFRDNLARGYVTVDTMSVCTLRYQGDPGFFGAGGTGDATNQNVLWGDFSYVDQNAKRAEGFPLVHIEANANDPETSVAGQYTFYGKFNGWSANDNREPLPATFGVRYLNGSAGTTSTASDLIVWRDSKVKQGAYTCGALPAWHPLGQERIEVADEAEHHYRFSRKVFPAVAQRVRVGRAPFALRYPFGWLHLNLNTAVAPAGAVPPEDPQAAQAWVATVQIGTLATGTVSVGFDALALDNACMAHHAFP